MALYLQCQHIENADVMDHIDNVNNSIKRLFNILESTGYYKKRSINALLIYMFLTDTVLEGPLSLYLDDEGKKSIEKALRCISQDHCLVSTATCRNHISKPYHNHDMSTFRITTGNDLRISENDIPRITEPFMRFKRNESDTVH